MSSFQFIHAADIHLDSPLRGLVGQDAQVGERVRSATREAFVNLITAAIEEKVGFVVLAGDLYDGDWRDYQTGLFFVGQMGRLGQVGIPAYVLYGNHDADSQITKRLELPANVKTFSARKAETHRVAGLDVALHGHSFKVRDIEHNLVPGYPEPLPNVFNIGVLHTGLGGKSHHANYAPCSLEDLTQKGYDYWALGHVHQAEILHERPHVAFSGVLQGRHIRETGPKGAWLVNVIEGEVSQTTALHVDVVRWEHLLLEVGNCDRLAQLQTLIAGAIDDAVEAKADGRMLVCRVELVGTTGLHESMQAWRELLTVEGRAHALGLGPQVAWVEKVVLATQPKADATALAEREDAIGELQRTLGQASADEAFVNRLTDEMGDLVRKLPLDVRTHLDSSILKLAVDGDFTGLVREVTPFLNARLSGEEN